MEIVQKNKLKGSIPNAEDWAEARESTLAIRFIQGANTKHNTEYLAHLHKSFFDGNNYYPRLVSEACTILACCELSSGTPVTSDGRKGVSFVKSGQSQQHNGN